MNIGVIIAVIGGISGGATAIAVGAPKWASLLLGSMYTALILGLLRSIA